eukprot:jgi/Chrpa1/22465/Chrysochromulina_OHIO_Genome00023408-RA
MRPVTGVRGARKRPHHFPELDFFLQSGADLPFLFPMAIGDVTAYMLLGSSSATAPPKNRLVEMLVALSKDMAEHDRPSPDEPLDFPEDLVDALANKKLLKHKDKTVRLHLACCLADYLRMIAPEMPYEDDPARLRDVLELLIQQLQGLEEIESSLYERH